MTISQQIAQHFRAMYFGGNWTVSCMKDILDDVNYTEATTKIDEFNTIATLTFHTNYFVNTLIKVLKEGVLEGNDKFSFDHPPIHSEEDWQTMVSNSLDQAEECAQLLEEVNDDELLKPFVDPKYKINLYNYLGIIEHTHYHMGQIALIKKMVKAKDANQA